MATFAAQTYNAAKYAAARPTYPRLIYQLVTSFHEGDALTKSRTDLAVDLGCGTGQATADIRRFTRVIGVDPSAKMVEGARNYIEQVKDKVDPLTKFEFVQSAAEKLDFLEDHSVDLVVSAQAAHWFDWKKLWPELSRVVKRHGTVAYWGYSEFRFRNYPTLTPLIHAYAQGSDPATSIGPYWEQPGRSILDNHFRDVPAAASIVSGYFAKYGEQWYFTGPYHPHLPEYQTRDIIMSKKTSWEGLEGWMRTYSALHNFQEKHPEDLERKEGDIVKRTIKWFREEMERVDAEKKERGLVKPEEQRDPEEVEIDYPLTLVMVKKL